MDEREEHKEPIEDTDGSVFPPGGAEPVTHESQETPTAEGSAPDLTAETEPVNPTSQYPPMGQGWIPLPSWQPAGPETAVGSQPEDSPEGPAAGSHGGAPSGGYTGAPSGGYSGAPYGSTPYAGGGARPYGPYPPYSPFGPPPADEPPRKSHKGRIIGGIVAAVVLIGAGTGIGTALSSGGSSKPSSASVFTNGTVPPSGTALHTTRIAAKVDPAIVDINTIVELPGGNAQAAGTGMIVSSDGYILTNNHVVEDATSIKVTIQGHPGRYTATFVGADPTADVAVIKVSGLSGLPVVTFGNSATLAVGDPVVAIGNALGLGGSPTVSTGIVSALNRAITASDSTGASEHLTGMIQTDAPIEPGNSGGPLVDAAGAVIGMDTAAASADGTGNSVGFAIPINRASSIATAIEHNQHLAGVVFGLPPFLGIDGQNVTLFGKGSGSGVNIVAVVPGTPAQQAGIQPGDVITKFDGKPTPTIQALSAAIHQLKPGDSATVTFQSQFGTQTVTVHLIPGPAA